MANVVDEQKFVSNFEDMDVQLGACIHTNGHNQFYKNKNKNK